MPSCTVCLLDLSRRLFVCLYVLVGIPVHTLLSMVVWAHWRFCLCQVHTVFEFFSYFCHTSRTASRFLCLLSASVMIQRPLVRKSTHSITQILKGRNLRRIYCPLLKQIDSSITAVLQPFAASCRHNGLYNIQSKLRVRGSSSIDIDRQSL